MRSIVVNINDANQRIDKFLQKCFRTMPLGAIYKFIRKKRVKVNGKRVDINYYLIENDVLELYINDSFFEEANKLKAANHKKVSQLVKPNLDILYEDENIIIVNKPQGMLSHSIDNSAHDTLIGHIQSYLQIKGEFCPENENTFSPSLCNRLDRNTAGITIAAKNAMSLRIINEKIRKHEISKFYLCIVHGTLNKKSETLEGYLTKGMNNKVSISNKKLASAKMIITKYKVLKELNNKSLIEVELITGRTHQIRAHLSSVGHPLIGDKKYGGNCSPFFLLSYKVAFNFKTDAQILNYLNGRTIEIEDANNLFILR